MSSKPNQEGVQIRELARFARFVINHDPLRAALALAFLFLGTLTEGISILLLIPVLQLVGEHREFVTLPLPGFLASWLGPQLQVGLIGTLLLILVLIVAQSLFMRFKSIYMAELLYDMVNQLRIALFESIARARWRLIAGLRGSDLNHALTADSDRIQAAAFQFLLLIQGGVLLAVYLCVSWLISPAMTMVAFVSGGVMLTVLYPVRRRASAYGHLMTENRREQYRTVTEFLAGVKVAKSFNSEPRFLTDLTSTLWRMRADFARFVRMSSMGSVLFQASSAIVLCIFAYGALRWFTLPLPKIVVLVFLFMRIAPRFAALQTNAQELLTNLPAFFAMMRVKDSCDREREEFHPPALSNLPLKQEIRFEHVGYRYGTGSSNVLRDLSFVVSAGTITAIIGPSGSGKSTVADILMGLLAPLEGAVLVDGRVLDQDNRRRWRDSVAYVPQEVFLLHDSIAVNLRLAAPAASEAEMWLALHRANAKGFVEALPQQLETVVGDRGFRLSGGERQRLSLARALLRQPQLLILDEATSALDWENQNLIARSLEALRGSMTIITIAHRLVSMIAFADRVIALEDGCIAEEGDYETLMKNIGSRLSSLAAAEGSGSSRLSSPAAAESEGRSPSP